jgi:hypothetical protein
MDSRRTVHASGAARVAVLRVALLCVCVTAVLSQGRSKGPPAASSTVIISAVAASPELLLMGQSVQVAVQWRYAQANATTVTGPLEAYPFVNGSQWGASLLLARKDGPASPAGHSTVSLPIPHAGLASVVWIVLRDPLPGVAVGVPLASLSATQRIATSNTLSIPVKHRAIVRLGRNGSSGLTQQRNVRIGLQWEPLLASLGAPPGGGGAGFAVAEAVPLIGRYSSYDMNALKQHAIWLAESGVEWVNIDWTNNLWGCAGWETNPNCPSSGIWKEVINATSFAIRGWQQLEAEGIPCPKAALMMGLMNGATASVAALNGQIQWVREHYPSSAFATHDGLPLLMVFDGAGTHNSLPQQLNASGFTLRWIAAALTTNTQLLSQGYFSWMDTTFPPAVTMKDGKPECTTISAGFFRFGPVEGWLTAPSENTTRRGGATFLRSMLTAFAHRPELLMIHQWNEFMGTPSGTTPPVAGKVFFGDEYNSSMSDDIEPTSLTECAGIRSGDSVCSGWGHLFLNLQRAFVAMLSGDYPAPRGDAAAAAGVSPTLLTIAAPTNRQLVNVATRTIFVEWVLLGATPSSFHISLTTAAGIVVAERNVTAVDAACVLPAPVVQDGKGQPLHFQRGCSTTLKLPPGGAIGGQGGRVVVNAAPLLTPFPLALHQVDEFTEGWVPLSASVTVILGPPFPAPPWKPAVKGRVIATGPIVSTAGGASRCLLGNANGTIGLGACTNITAASAQLWRLMSTGEIHSVRTGSCLDAAYGKIGRHVYGNTCVGNGVGQLWQTDGGTLELRSAETCVDGATLLIATCGAVGKTAGVWSFPTPR